MEQPSNDRILPHNDHFHNDNYVEIIGRLIGNLFAMSVYYLWKAIKCVLRVFLKENVILLFIYSMLLFYIVNHHQGQMQSPVLGYVLMFLMFMIPYYIFMWVSIELFLFILKCIKTQINYAKANKKFSLTGKWYNADNK